MTDEHKKLNKKPTIKMARAKKATLKPEIYSHDTLFKILIATLVYFIFAYCYNFYSDNQKSPTSNTPQSDSILSIISKTITLPAGTPEYYTIDNQEELSIKNNFYSHAISGDILVYFAESGKGIIYSKEEGRVRYMADLKLNQAFK